MSAVALPAPPVKVSTRSRRDQVLIVVMVVAVLAGAFYLLAWKPQSAALSSARDEQAGAEAELATATAAATQASTGEGDAAATAEAEADAVVLTAVPADIATAEVLRQLDGLATQTGVQLGNITLTQPAALVADPAATASASPTAGATISGPVSLGVSLDVSGDPAATSAFLAGLVPIPRLVVVDQVTVQNTAADETAGTPALQKLQLSLRVFATGA